MFKFLFGVGVGVLLITYNVIPKVKEAFIDTGVRNAIVDSLKEMENN